MARKRLSLFTFLRLENEEVGIKKLGAWLGLALVVSLFYVALSVWQNEAAGFPLDDAWIHQTYARNLARTGQLAFTPGIPSAGSTAPLWTVLLSLGYLLGIPFQWWAYGLGVCFLGLTGATLSRLAGYLFPDTPSLGLWAGLFCVVEWHLVWAAVSGMETMLFVWLSLLLVEQYLAAEDRAVKRMSRGFWLGVLGGLLLLTRPEGAGLLGLIGLDMALRRWYIAASPWSIIFRRWLALAAGVALLLLPYVAFHLYLTGLPFPNTLYAKQAEYGEILRSYPIWWRLLGNVGPPVESVQGVFRVIFIGAQILLLPGLFYAAWLTIKEKRWSCWFVWVWWVSYLLLYALRLPVTYQHGRYQIPAIVWVVLLGMWGMLRLLGQRKQPLLQRTVSRAWAISLGLLALAFSWIGAQAYARDVRFIENEMVTVAHWLQTHTAPDAVLALHDIGAIGYFTERRVLDLAGLVTPQVIPFIRDETALLEFVVANRATYLVTFPSWYPVMVKDSRLTPIYSTAAATTIAAAGDNMVVYQLHR